MRAFSESFLGSLLHDLNVVHAMLGAARRAAAGAGRRRATGGTRAARSTARCASRTARAVDGAWIQLLDTFEYRETIRFMFAEEVHTLEFPSPWLKQHPTEYRRSRRDGRAAEAVVHTSYDESFSRELRHFHACIVEGERRAARRPRTRGSTSTC